MHEFHLMAEVVRIVAERVPGAGSPATGGGARAAARPALVRLKVNACSHLMADGGEALQSAFALAARGTALEGARLELLPVPVTATCPGCDAHGDWDGVTLACPACGAGPVTLEDVPEVVVHEVVVEE